MTLSRSSELLVTRSRAQLLPDGAGIGHEDCGVEGAHQWPQRSAEEPCHRRFAALEIPSEKRPYVLPLDVAVCAADDDLE